MASKLVSRRTGKEVLSNNFHSEPSTSSTLDHIVLSEEELSPKASSLSEKDENEHIEGIVEEINHGDGEEEEEEEEEEEDSNEYEGSSEDDDNDHNHQREVDKDEFSIYRVQHSDTDEANFSSDEEKINYTKLYSNKSAKILSLRDGEYESEDDYKTIPDTGVCGKYRPKFWPKIREMISLDYRTLAFYRFGLGLLTLMDMFNRLFYLSEHYTDDGVLTREQFWRHYTIFHPSVHLWTGEYWPLFFVFIVHGLVGFLFMIGYRTKLMNWILWFFTVSLHNRNPMVLQGGDTYFRLLIFWGLFLPLGNRWSVDQALKRREIMRPRKSMFPPSTVTIGAFGALCQVSFVYVFSGIHKYDKAWHEGHALAQTLDIDQFTTHFGVWARQYCDVGDICRLLTLATLYLEIYGPFLCLIPWKTGFWRFVCFFGFAGFHAGTAFTMHLGLFPWIGIVGVALYIPTSFWDLVFKRLQATMPDRTSLIVYYTPEVSSWARIIYTLLLAPGASFYPATAFPQVHSQLKRKSSSWVCTSSSLKGAWLYGDQALEHILYTSPIAWPVATTPGQVMRTAFNTCYAAIPQLFKSAAVSIWSCPSTTYKKTWHKALSNPTFRYRYFKLNRRRRKYQRRALKRLGLKKPWERKVFWDLMIGYISCLTLLFIFLYNLRGLKHLGFDNNWVLPKELFGFAKLLRVEQSWKMFAPRPLTDDGWFVWHARTFSKKDVELFPGYYPPKRLEDGVSYDKPEYVAHTYPSQRWRKYLMNLRRDTNSHHYPYVVAFAVRRWNAIHDPEDHIESMDMIFMRDPTTLRSNPNFRPVPKLMYSWTWDLLEEEVEEHKKHDWENDENLNENEPGPLPLIESSPDDYKAKKAPEGLSPAEQEVSSRDKKAAREQRQASRNQQT